MHIQVEQESLAGALRSVSGVVQLRPLVPEAGGVLLSADGHLTLTGTGREVTVECRVSGADVTEPGAVLLPARLTTELVSALGDDRLDLRQEAEPLGMAFQSSRTTARVRGWEAGKFPRPAEPVQMEVVASVDGETLRQGITGVAYAASSDESSEVLRGVGLEVDENRITLVAADGFRLAIGEVPVKREGDKQLSIVAPAAGLRIVSRLMGKGEVEVSVDAKRRHVRFAGGETVVTCGLLSGAYPDYNELLKHEWDVAATVDRRDLEVACGTARALSGAVARLLFAPDGTLTLSVVGKRGEGEPEGRTEIASQAEGAEAELMVSTLYLSQAAGAFPSRLIRLRCNGADSRVPLLMESVAEESEGQERSGLGSHRALIMPMVGG